jgi:hypothetical protein
VIVALGFIDSWITIACAVGALVLFWFFCNRVADAWRGLVQPPADDGGKPSRGKVL